MENQTTNTPSNLENDIILVRNSILESLKFVEAKHTGLIALNSGLIFGLFSIYKELNKQNHWSLIAILCIFAISIFISLIAFYPLSKLRKKTGIPNDTASNILYSEELVKLSKNEFEQMLREQPNRIQEDLLNWTHNIACVSTRKYKLFRKAIHCSITGLILTLIIGICHVICHIICQFVTNS